MSIVESESRRSNSVPGHGRIESSGRRQRPWSFGDHGHEALATETTSVDQI